MTIAPSRSWPRRRLGDVTAVRSGGTPSRAEAKFWREGSIPWVTTSEVDGSQIVRTAQHITTKGLEASSAKLFPAGTVLIAMYGQGKTRGQSGQLGIDAATNQACAALLCGPEIDNQFLFQCLQHSYAALRGLSNSGGQDNLSAALIGSFPVPVPPLPEQRKIAEILRTWDDTIERKQKLIAATRELQRNLIRRALADSPETKNVPLSRVVRPLSTKNSVGETRVLTSSAIHGLVSQSDYFKKSVAGADISGYYLLHRGDFAYNRSSSNGFPYGAIRRLEEHERGVISTLYLCFTPIAPELADPGFLAHAFASGVLDSQLALICHEGARSHGLLNVARADFFELVVPLPSIERQKLVAAALSEADTEVALLDRELELLRTQKRGLMQKLLTGEVRVTVEEVAG